MTTQPASARCPEWTLGDKMRKARELAGLSQIEMAVKIGISRQSVSNYEVGVTERPRRIVLNAWAGATDVPVEWFADGGPGDDGTRNQKPAGIWSKRSHLALVSIAA